MGFTWETQKRCKLTDLHTFVLWEGEEWTTVSWSLRHTVTAGWDHPHLTGMTSSKNPIEQPAKNPADEAAATTSRRWEVEPAGWGCVCTSCGFYWNCIWTRTLFLQSGSSMQIKKWVSINTHSGIAFIVHFDFWVFCCISSEKWRNKYCINN